MRTRPLLPVLVVAALAACGGEKTSSNKNLPIAKFTANPTSARPQVFKLDATESIATVGRIAKYRWTFGDESTGKDATVPTEVYAYAAAGTYTITLVVEDDLGTASEPVTQEVTVASVNNAAPKAVIVASNTAAPAVLVSFDGSASTPQSDLQKYQWEFGDPASGSLNVSDKVSAQHLFLSAGNYRVKLTVTDSLGQSDTAEHLIAIGQVGPVAACTFSPSPAQQGVPVMFDGSASSAPDGATIKTYIWDFDDGSSGGTGVTATHTYNVLATFKPKLQVIDSHNRVAETTCPDVVVEAPPLCVADYALTATPPDQSCAGSKTTWAGVKLHIEEKADGTVVGTEKFGTQTIIYNGTWSGVTFTLSGTYSQDDGLGGTIETQATITGTFTGCGGWTGTWVEDKTWSGFPLCNLTWNLSASQQ